MSQRKEASRGAGETPSSLSVAPRLCVRCSCFSSGLPASCLYRAPSTRPSHQAVALTMPDVAPPPDVDEAIRSAPRLAALRGTGLLDTAAEPAFDRLTRPAVRLLRVPASFLSLVDEERDFYKAATGFGQ